MFELGGSVMGRWSRIGVVTVVVAVGSAEARTAPAADADNGPIVVTADPFTLDAPGLAPGQIEMTTVSARPSLVAGGQARVEVRGLDASDRLTVTRGDEDVTSAFSAVAHRPGVVTGVVDGLRLGRNRLRATAVGDHGRRTVALAVTNHPIEGPVISGPHQEPFVCRTAEAGMGPPLDDDCSAPTQVAWYARNLLGQFERLADPYAPYPLLTASTVANGRTVPFVVRVESTVINRSITRIAVLDDPRARGRDAPFVVSPAWNRRLVYQFGASCGTGHHQGVSEETAPVSGLPGVDVSNPDGLLLDLAGRLGSGYATALSTLTTLGVHCNDLLPPRRS